MPLSLFKEKNIILVTLITIAIFIADLQLPLWYDVWLLYLIPLFAMYQSSARRPYVYTAIITLLVASSLFLSHADSTPLMHSALNRITGIFGGWGVSVLLMRLKHLQASLLQSRDELEKRVEERTDELSSLEKAMAERKKIEEALRDNEERYRLLFYKTPIGIFNYDNQLVLTAWNDRFMEILHSSSAKLEGLDMNTLKDQSVVPALRKAIEGDEGHYEGFYETTTGPAKIWVSMHTAPIFNRDGEVNYCVGIVEDITERMQAVVKLRQSEEAYRRIVETAREGIWSWDGQYRTTFVNAAMAQMLGYTQEEMIGTPIERYLFEEDLEDHRLRTEARQRGIYENFERRYRRKEGEACWCLVSAAPLQDAAGRFVGSFLMCTDITKRKTMEETLHNLEEQLRQSQKMEAIGTLAGGVAHDFNNILTAITGYGSLAQERLKEDEKTQGYIREVLKAANRATELTRGLLAFSRKQTISLKQENLNDIVQNIQKMLARIIGEHIKLKTVLSNKMLPVSVDAGQIDQVLLNLATNARDAMPDGGHLIIETDVVDMDRSYAEAHLFQRTGKYAVLTVSDTGIGMDLKTKENIFEPFFTTKEVGKGTGLGLAMVYGIIKQHGGNINVYSEVGRGTTFRIYLPIVKAAEKEESETVRPIPLGKGEKILIAEDDAQVREILSMSLKKHGYEIVEAGNGEEAVKRFLENGDAIAILLLDVIMPVKNGREAYEEIQWLKPGIKAVFMSGYTDDIISKNGILEEGFDFISKPINPATLMRKIRDALDR